ncbi:MAG: hypothetical protein RIT26_1289, partial [Pseudomonadota bacterium]
MECEFVLKIFLNVIGLAGCVLWSAGVAAQALASNPNDAVILDMASAFKRGDVKKLSQSLPQARGHVLEPWAAYWELRARLDQATEAEVRQFLARYPNTYQEDRLRNDWLLLLGSRRDWTTLAEEHIHYRMRDDREVQCYMNLVEWLRQGPRARPELSEETYQLWLGQREGDEGCALAVDRLFDARQLSATQIWRKARLAAEAGRPKGVRQALEILQPKSAPAVNDWWARPGRWLGQYAANPRKASSDVALLALIRLSTSDASMAEKLLRTIWQPALSAEQRHWLWGLLGKQAAMRLDDDALAHFKKV